MSKFRSTTVPLGTPLTVTSWSENSLVVPPPTAPIDAKLRLSFEPSDPYEAMSDSEKVPPPSATRSQVGDWARPGGCDRAAETASCGSWWVNFQHVRAARQSHPECNHHRSHPTQVPSSHRFVFLATRLALKRSYLGTFFVLAGGRGQDLSGILRLVVVPKVLFLASPPGCGRCTPQRFEWIMIRL